jgi:hypothetical protein
MSRNPWPSIICSKSLTCLNLTSRTSSRRRSSYAVSMVCFGVAWIFEIRRRCRAELRGWLAMPIGENIWSGHRLCWRFKRATNRLARLLSAQSGSAAWVILTIRRALRELPFERGRKAKRDSHFAAAAWRAYAWRPMAPSGKRSRPMSSAKVAAMSIIVSAAPEKMSPRSVSPKMATGSVTQPGG